MTEDSPADTSDMIGLAAEIVAAYVSNNSLPASELPELIGSVHQALLMRTVGETEAPKEELKPAVPIRKSVTADHIVCLDDGKKFKSLKRHLRTTYGLTPDEYRAKWGLPSDYPMVAPSYAAARSELAKKMGLGRQAAARRKASAGRKAA